MDRGVDMNDERTVPVMRIRPEPEPAELAAIVAAVTAALNRTPAPAGPAPPTGSRWGRQGRIDAMRGLDRHDDPGDRRGAR
jgi:hypothetical protein